MRWLTGLALATEASSEMAIVLRATLILVATLALLALAGRGKASVRHLLLATMFGALLLLPAAVTLTPTIDIHVLDPSNRSRATADGYVSAHERNPGPADAFVDPAVGNFRSVDVPVWASTWSGLPARSLSN